MNTTKPKPRPYYGDADEFALREMRAQYKNDPNYTNLQVALHTIGALIIQRDSLLTTLETAEEFIEGTIKNGAVPHPEATLREIRTAITGLKDTPDTPAVEPARDFDIDSIEGALEWALQKARFYMLRICAPDDPEWNDYKHAHAILYGPDPLDSA